MLDEDLADFHNVTTGNLNKAVCPALQGWRSGM
jgi:hypothetical protein